MWIQYSWGSLTKIQIAAAVMIQNRLLPRLGSHRAPHDLVRDEEVLERVGEDQQQRAPLGRLEGDDADQAVEEQGPAHRQRVAVGPVPQHGQVGDGQVVHVHRLVVALVAGRVVPQLLEDGLVDPVEHQGRDDGGQRKAGHRPVLRGGQPPYRRGEPPADGRPAPPGPRRGRRRIAGLLERFDLTDAARKPLATYSGGMRRRLDLAMTLVGDPAVIFLDEPTTGLDPRSRRTMWQIIRELAGDGVTIFLTTQYLDEADQLADRVAVLDQGRIVAEGTPAELKRRIPGGHIQLQFAGPARSRAAAGLIPDAPPDSDQLTLQVPGDGSVASLRRRARPARPRRRRRRGPLDPHPRPGRRVLRRHRPHRHHRRGRPDGRRRSSDDVPHLHRRRLGTMLRRNLKHQLRYPSLTLMLAGFPIVFLLLFVYVFGGQLGSGLAAAARPARRPRRLPQLHRARHPHHDRGLRRAGHRDLGRQRHDRRHHRPLPHHGDHPRRRADRPRRREPAPDARRPGPRDRGRPGPRIPIQRRTPANGSLPPGSSCCSRSPSSGCPPRSASPPRASRPPATPRCS